MGGVGGRDGDPVDWIQNMLDPVETFGRELVVAEGAEEFRNQDVDVAVA